MLAYILEKIFHIYLVVQIYVNPIGLISLGITKPILVQKMKEKGYVPVKSMYKLNENFLGVIKLIVPCYYGIEALKMIDSSGEYNKVIDRMLAKGKIKKESERKDETAFNPDDSIFRVRSRMDEMERYATEKYTTRKNNYLDSDKDVVIDMNSTTAKLRHQNISPFNKPISKSELTYGIRSLSKDEQIELYEAMGNALNKEKKTELSRVLEKTAA